MDINIFKKYKKIFIIILLIIILAYPAYSILNKLSYRYRVDNVFSEKVKKDLRSVPEYFSEDILVDKKFQDKSSLPVKFGDWLIKLETEPAQRKEDGTTIYYSIYSIKISKDSGETWNNLFIFNDLGTSMCRIAVVYKEKINCIVNGLSVGLNLLTIDENGKYANKILTKSSIASPEILAAYTEGTNKLIFIWRDQRARFPVFDLIDPARGPYLIIAGELDLDTLEFKEHIIKYDSYTFP